MVGLDSEIQSTLFLFDNLKFDFMFRLILDCIVMTCELEYWDEDRFCLVINVPG